jgi:heat shock protein HslJ
MRLMIPALTFTLLLAGCMTAGAATDQEFRDRDWTLTWVDGASSIPSEGAPTIRFGTDGRMAGSTGCNSASADYTTSGDNLRIGMMITTKRACVDPERNRLESVYVDALNAVRRYRITNGQFELLDESGTVVARYR